MNLYVKPPLWWTVFLVTLALPLGAHATLLTDLCNPYVPCTVTTSANGLYTAVISQFDLWIDGPQGVENFNDGILLGGAPLLNNYGELVGLSDGGTSDLFLFFAIYGRGGARHTFTAGGGIGYLGAVPDDAIFGSLGWDAACPMGCGGNFYGTPFLGSLSDSGLVSAALFRYPLATVPISWQLPDLSAPPTFTAFAEAPEPGSLAMLAAVIGMAALGLRRGHYHKAI